MALEKSLVVSAEKALREPEAPTEQRVVSELTAEENLQVMILTDEPIVGKRLEPALTKSAFEVEAFLDPTEAIARLGEKEFDIVVTDLRLEGMDDIHILEPIKGHCEHTRIILITGYTTVDAVERRWPGRG